MNHIYEQITTTEHQNPDLGQVQTIAVGLNVLLNSTKHRKTHYKISIGRLTSIKRICKNVLKLGYRIRSHFCHVSRTKQTRPNFSFPTMHIFSGIYLLFIDFAILHKKRKKIAKSISIIGTEELSLKANMQKEHVIFFT